MPAVHIRRDFARAAERESELDALVSLHLASTALGRKAVFCARVKGHEAIEWRAQEHLVHTRAFLYICRFYLLIIVVLFIMCDWSNEFTLKFLELYQNEPVIWDPMHLYHKDRKQINDAWVRLREQLECPVTEIKKKKDSLMATFRGHLRKKKHRSDQESV